MAANLLVVDDSRFMRRVIIRTLRESGIEINACFEAQDGVDALAILENQRVDVVILDIHMPRMSGNELLWQIRKDPEHRSLPVVIVSVDSSLARIRQLSDLRTRVIQKPFSAQELISFVLEAISSDCSSGVRRAV